MAIEVFAAAKINLTLHVTGQRADGYHLLDSLVVFADVGDTIRATDAPDLTLTLTGPEAADLPQGDDNIVMRAARLMSQRTGNRGAALTLHKVLPMASGIGGGSADAAATLRALAQLWDVPLPPDVDVIGLGADVPVCLTGDAVRMTGVGEALHPLAHRLPGCAVLLVNPRIPLATPAVFRALDRRDLAPMQHPLPRFSQLSDLTAFLADMRNDLEPAAIRLQPLIARVKAALAAESGCRFARMSGSGATCFGLFDTLHAARAAAQSMRRAEPGWWVAAAPLRVS